MWCNNFVNTDIQNAVIKCSNLYWCWDEAVFKGNRLSISQIISITLINRIPFSSLQCEFDTETTLMIGIFFISFGSDCQNTSDLCSCLQLNSHLLFDCFNCLFVVHEGISFKSKRFEGAVVEFMNSAIKSYIDILWCISITWVIFGWDLFLSIEIICKWTFVSMEFFKNLFGISLVAIAFSETTYSPFSFYIFKSLTSIFIISIFPMGVAQNIVCFTNLIEVFHGVR